MPPPKKLSDFFQTLFAQGSLIQVWSLSPYYAGIFNDFDLATDAVKELKAKQASGIFVTPNPVIGYHYLSGGQNRNQLHRSPKHTAANDDVTERLYYMVDIDTVRPEGLPATNEELQAADKVLARWKTEIKEAGFPEPVVIHTGNGYHCLLRAQGGTKPDRNIYKHVLKHWAAICKVEGAHVDDATFDFRRGVRIPGCMNRKMVETEDRPHRKASIAEWPEELKPVTDAQMLEYARASGYTERSRNQDGDWELVIEPDEMEEFCDEYLCLHHVTQEGDTTWFALFSCPLCGGHKSIADGKGKCCIVLSSDSLYFSCFYCNGKWKDVIAQLREEHDEIPYTFWSCNIDEDEVWERAMEAWGLEEDDIELVQQPKERVMYKGNQISRQSEQVIVDYKSMTTKDLYDAFVRKAMVEDATYTSAYDQTEFRDRVQECLASEDVAAMAQYLGQRKVDEVWDFKFRPMTGEEFGAMLAAEDAFFDRAVAAKDWSAILDHLGEEECHSRLAGATAAWVPEFREWLRRLETVMA